MYLIIFEDGNSNTMLNLSDDDLNSALDGYCDLYRFSGGDIEKYTEGEWQLVKLYVIKA